ncbi:hypothetical protein [Halobellus rubicundus]|uniref:Uncharacterized protein n=1 Tax=Halobellus rubicundus TaxID=2996466 RepID=A0ABD5MAU8_9EURY
MQLALVWAYEALYELRIVLERYRRAVLQRQYEQAISLVPAEELDSFAEELPPEAAAAEPIEWVARMARDYYGCEQFAEEVLGISLAEWVGGVSGGEAVIKEAAEVLELYASALDIGEGGANGSADVIEVAADAEELFATLQEEWRQVDGPRFVMD